MNTFITILVLIVMLGILISTHELGHLLVAKAFNVYCLEYSIGFGPKLFSWKTKKGETTYSLRAFPLGGYVSMYQEGVELPEGVVIPADRCLEHKKAWQKSLVMLAGITVNLLTCVLFTFIYTIGFPTYYQSEAIYTGYKDEAGTSNIIAYGLWANGKIGNEDINSDNEILYIPEIAVDSNNNQIGFVLDSSATITRNGESTTVVAVYLYQNLKENDLLNCTTFYYAKENYSPTEVESKMGIVNKADTDKETFNVRDGDVLSMNLMFLDVESKDARPEYKDVRNTYTYASKAVANGDNVSWEEDTLSVTTLKYWAPLGERIKNGFSMLGNYFVSIGQGLKSIFTFNFSQIGSVVAMGSVLSQSSAAVGWGRTFFVYGGFLGLNLAILNLLPFPGLDGWQLLVVIVEKIRGKKIPDKVKGIVSMVGIGILLLFGIAIIIKDIVGLII